LTIVHQKPQGRPERDFGAALDCGGDGGSMEVTHEAGFEDPSFDSPEFAEESLSLVLVARI